MDTYGLTKALAYRNPEIKPYLIINCCESEAEALKCSETLKRQLQGF